MNTAPTTGSVEPLTPDELVQLKHLAESGRGWAYRVLAQEAERRGNQTEGRRLRDLAYRNGDPWENLSRIQSQSSRLASGPRQNGDACQNSINLLTRIDQVESNFKNNTEGMSVQSVDILRGWLKDIENSILEIKTRDC